MTASFEEICEAPVLKSTLKNVFQNQPYSVVERPASFVFLLNKELEDKIVRLLLLKPHGFTSNSLHELSSHPEARTATIEIKGIIRKGNNGYILDKNVLDFAFLPTKKAPTIELYPYAPASMALHQLKNSRIRFSAIKSNGFGFYHNLINRTEDWLLMILRKKIDQTKPINAQWSEDLPVEQKEILTVFLTEIQQCGDRIFNEKTKLLKKIIDLPPNSSLPALIQFLNVPESGKHEQCSVFATILKIAKKEPKLAHQLIQEAQEKTTAPAYYLNELLQKIS